MIRLVDRLFARVMYPITRAICWLLRVDNFRLASMLRSLAFGGAMTAGLLMGDFTSFLAAGVMFVMRSRLIVISDGFEHYVLTGGLDSAWPIPEPTWSQFAFLRIFLMTANVAMTIVLGAPYYGASPIAALLLLAPGVIFAMSLYTLTSFRVAQAAPSANGR